MVIFISFVVLLITGIALYFFFYQAKGIVRIKRLLVVKETYATRIQGKKRLIVGGSDVLYSFDTAFLNEREELPHVNFGLNVGLGMQFILDTAMKNARSGDEIICCFAYSLYYRPNHDIFAYEYYRMYNRHKLKRFSLKEQAYYLFANVRLNFKFVEKKFDISECGSYQNIAFSDLDSSKNKPLRFPHHFEETEAIQALHRFVRMAKRKNINVKLTYPSTLGFDAYESSSYIADLKAYLESNFTVIGSPSDYFVPISEIANSVYHVNQIGQRKRTEKFLQELLDRKRVPL
ncbi:hypothetical protein DFP96_102134 [Listeria rocourtiae]|uniref:SGNH/GDSL hydrolase family protein n=1 Tax=Listeria rocourtiae TaxID=647910 RepID=A0A4R6ZPZ3_9LIST|nr:hypothetical protein PROCOU_12008 [Listeria rocourtiae FSL F6-920]TDR54548.1 hypothetical protein DFP96_102134 [Listeria rocourtiae]